ncbi:MAG: cysteine desulfurase family protein [Planctomycetota bacterium]
MKYVFLDYASTTPVLPRFLKVFNREIKNIIGNPSSVHRLGHHAKEKLNMARRTILDSINAKSAKCIFTSGGTEANNLAIIGCALSYASKGNHIIASSYEHHCVLNSLGKLAKNGFKISYVRPDKDGYITLDNIKKYVTGRTILISCMLVNNELGVINNLSEIGNFCKENNIIFHTDAVAGITRIKIDYDKWNIDILTASSHKIYVPKGTGVVIVRNGILLSPILFGGSQEYGIRPGTQNVANSITFAYAVKYLYNNPHINKKIENMRSYFEQKVTKEIPRAVVNCQKSNRISHISNISFLAINAQDLVLSLSEQGICASTGAACVSGKENISHVLASLPVEKERKISAIRFSFGIGLTKKDIDSAVKIISLSVKRLRDYS